MIRAALLARPETGEPSAALRSIEGPPPARAEGARPRRRPPRPARSGRGDGRKTRGFLAEVLDPVHPPGCGEEEDGRPGPLEEIPDGPPLQLVVDCGVEMERRDGAPLSGEDVDHRLEREDEEVRRRVRPEERESFLRARAAPRGSVRRRGAAAGVACRERDRVRRHRPARPRAGDEACGENQAGPPRRPGRELAGDEERRGEQRREAGEERRGCRRTGRGRSGSREARKGPPRGGRSCRGRPSSAGPGPTRKKAHAVNASRGGRRRGELQRRGTGQRKRALLGVAQRQRDEVGEASATIPEGPLGGRRRGQSRGRRRLRRRAPGARCWRGAGRGGRAAAAVTPAAVATSAARVISPRSNE